MNWNSHEFIWLDWTILAVGIVAVIWAVWRSVQKDKRSQQGASSEDYLFGKGEPWYIIGAAIFAANIGSEHLVGLAGTGAKSGVGMAHWEMQGWMILLLGWLFVPFYQLLNNKMGKIITMPDFLKYRYTPRTGSWLSIITLIAYSAMNVGADGHAYGANHMFHWTEADPMYQDYPGFWVFIGASIIGFWYWCTDQHIVQRVLGQRKGEDNDVVMKRARRGTIAAGYFKILPVFMFLIPGMVAAALAAKGEFDMSNTDAAFAVMVKDVLPAGVKGIVTIGFICALVASLAAFFNSCATLFTEDFYKPMFKNKSEATYVMVGRIATVVVVILGMAWIPVMMSLGSLYDYLQGIQSLLAPAMVAVFALGIFSKKITPKAGETAMIVGFLIGMLRLLTNILTNTGKDVMTGWFWENTTWFWQTNWLIFEIWLLVFLLLLMVVVSCFTPAPTAKQVEAITFTGSYKELIRKSWNKWDVITSLGVVLLCALFYAYFW